MFEITSPFYVNKVFIILLYFFLDSLPDHRWFTLPPTLHMLVSHYAAPPTPLIQTRAHTRK